VCFKSVIILVQDKNTSLKLPVVVSPKQEKREKGGGEFYL
jgi:hypothetical protein